MTGKRAIHRQPNVIVGREREREQLLELLDTTLAGRGALALVSGEAGIGKSTLVGELMREAEARGALVLSGACYDLIATPPYGPWSEILRGYGSRHDAPAPSSWIDDPEDIDKLSSQESLFEELRRYVSAHAGERPLVIVLEDLHWSDPASLEALRYFARLLDTLPALLVATFRTDEIVPRHPLFHLLPLLVREAEAMRIELRSLSSVDVRALLRQRYSLAGEDESRLAAYLRARTDGNPFYLTEVLRVLEHEQLLYPGVEGWQVGDLADAPVPPLVRQVIEGQLLRHGSDVQRLLEVAAVIGQNVPLDAWQAASGAGDPEFAGAIAQAIEANLIVELPDSAAGVSFAHALVRETLYLRQPLPQRWLLHQKIAEILAARPEPPLNDVAWHFGRADDVRAVDWLVRAGERAMALYATKDAISMLTRAHEMAGRFGRDLPLAVYRTRASANALIGEFERARHDHEFVLNRARLNRDHREEWQALIDLGMLWAERDYERTGNYCRASLELARSVGDQHMIGHSLNRIANWHVNLDDDMATALPLHREALSIFERHGDQEAVADTLDLLGMASYLGADLAASTSYYERAISIYRDIDNRQRLAGCLAAMALNGGEMNSEVAIPVYRESAYWIGCGEEALSIAREIGWRAGEALALFTLSMVTGARGELGRALDHVETMLATSEQIQHRQWTIAARFTLGWIWIAYLDLERAADELEQALALARTSGSRLWLNFAACGLASARIASGDAGQAAAVLGGIMQSSEPGVSGVERLTWFTRAEIAIAQGEPDRALEIIEQLESTMARTSPDQSTPALMKLHGDALAALGRIEAAERKYLAAREAASLFEFRPHLWRIDHARGELYRASGRPDQARAAFGSASATIESIAEMIPDAQMRERFRERALACRPDAPASDHGVDPGTRLSPRELEVLRHLVNGLSDREIAEALFISPRTVMRHVTNILDKLDVSSRTAAATLAIRRNIV